MLAADSAVFDRGCYCGSATKAWRGPDGSIAAGAGSLGDIMTFRDWFVAGETGERPTFKSDSEAMIIRPDGRMLWFGEKAECELEGPFLAAGSGFRIAMGALHAGASAERAIEISCDLDENTRRPITVLRLSP